MISSLVWGDKKTVSLLVKVTVCNPGVYLMRIQDALHFLNHGD